MTISSPSSVLPAANTAPPPRPTVRPGHPSAYDPTQKQKAQAKTARIPVKVVQAERLKKPEWIRVRAAAPNSRFTEIKRILRENNLYTVCEEGSFHLHDHGG